MEYAGVLFAVDGQQYYTYVDEDRRIVLAPVTDVAIAGWVNDYE